MGPFKKDSTLPKALTRLEKTAIVLPFARADFFLVFVIFTADNTPE